MARRKGSAFLYRILVVTSAVAATIGIVGGIKLLSRTPDDRVAHKLGISREQVQRARKNLGLSTSSLIRMNQQEVRSLILEEQHQDITRYREGFWAMLHRDERHRIPPGALIEALRQNAALRMRITRTRYRVAGVPVRQSSKPLPTAGLSAFRW